MTCFQRAWHAHAPRACPVQLFSPCVRTLCVSSALPPAPELPRGTFSSVPTCPPVPGQEKTSTGLGLPVPGRSTRGPGWPGLFVSGSFRSAAVCLWVSHPSCCFSLYLHLRRAYPFCRTGHRGFLPDWGSCRRAGQNGRSLVLGFRSLNWLLRQRVASGQRVGWRSRSGEGCVSLARRDARSFRGRPLPKIKTWQMQEEPRAHIRNVQVQTRVAPPASWKGTSRPTAPFIDHLPQLPWLPVHHRYGWGRATRRPGGRCPLPFTSKGKVADRARKRPVLGLFGGEPQLLPARTSFYGNPPQPGTETAARPYTEWCVAG